MANWRTPKTDWVSNPKSPTAEDFNRIEENTEHVLEQIEAKKGAIVDAINNKGQSADIEDTYAELANKINNIIDSIEMVISFTLLTSSSTGSTTKTIYIDKPPTTGNLFMLIDLMEDNEYQSISVCNLQTFKWNCCECFYISHKNIRKSYLKRGQNDAR